MPLYLVLVLGLLSFGASLLLAEMLPLTRRDDHSDREDQPRSALAMRSRLRRRD